MVVVVVEKEEEEDLEAAVGLIGKEAEAEAEE